jgi:signal transduction histidine kinase
MLRLRRIRAVAVVVLAAAVELLVWRRATSLRWGGAVPLWVVPTLVIPVFGALLLRWRYPMPIFALEWVYALAGLPIPGYEPLAGLLVALHAVARRASTRIAILALIACMVPFGIDSYNTGVAQRQPVAGSLVAASLWVVASLTAWGFGWHGRLAEDQGRCLLEQREAQAAEALHAERLQLARELHDIVANAVTAMLLQAAGARTVVGVHDEQVRRSLAAIEHAGAQAIAELHRLLGLLRAESPGSADGTHVHDQPGLEDIPALLELHRGTGLGIDAITEGRPCRALDPSVALAAYRIVQEALTNSSKYAGQHARVSVRQIWHADRLTLTIRDSAESNAAPTPTTAVLSSGHGLRGLTERVTLVGGHLHTGPTDGGFLIRADLPVSTATGPRAADAGEDTP